MPATATVAPSLPSKPGRSEGSGTSSSGSLCGDEAEGLTADLFQKLRLLLVKHCDVFHLEISHDEPIKVEPLRV
ncbi:hypothetical protein DYB28_002142 [Aphanomyces astaci]|uniref:Uncharacterized protein n=1 Tax=Aphanomyces astaci TaxID=112090 RepID=A0A397CBG8_APHAT|nr:hypothetical protein DYB38_012050 [Aphanomyces astaci]RHY82768.1 hypothetical protein DYB31_008649 [Aphanomyces astaci]RLO11603.1 hypothetical protein DYB28_002142 [Aphanomyces astaci]